MDGVIADTEPLHAHAYLEAFKTFGIHVSKNRYRKAITVDGKTPASWFVELGGDSRQIDALYRQKDQIYFPLVKERAVPRLGLLNLLSDLRASSVACALATSARRVNADLVLDLFDLRQFFTAILSLEDVSHVKPHPEAFLLALDRLASQPHNTVILEDAPKGVRAAVNAGIPVVAVPTSWTCHYRFHGAALVVDSMEKLSVNRLDNLLKERLDPRKSSQNKGSRIKDNGQLT
jgi:HAD superfamily hydrolase (TIGR01509 family)